MINIINAPLISGLKFRHFNGESDYSQIAAVLIASEGADNTQRDVSADDIASAYQHLSNCDPYNDMIVAEVAGVAIG